ncbi:CHAT domain-containing protein, partial [Mycena maculata]
ISEEIENLKHLIEQATHGHPDLPGHLMKLGEAFTRRYTSSGNLDDLESALQNTKQAVDITPVDHPERPGCLRSLTASFVIRYQRLGDLKDITGALKTSREALDLIKTDHPDRAAYLQDVAESFGIRYQRLGNLTDLEETIQKGQEALDMVQKGHPDRASYLQTLAVSFSERYDRLGDLEDLQAALKWAQESVALTPTDNPNRAGHLQNLAVSSRDRYQRLGDPNDVETAIQSDKESLVLTPTDHLDRAGCLQSLSMSLKQRYWRVGDPRDLDEALQCDQEAVDLTPRDHFDRAGRLQGLATSLTNRYQLLGNLEDLEAALQSDQEALELTPVDDPDRARQLHNLGRTFGIFFERLGNVKDLQKSLKMEAEALDLTPPDHPDRPKFLQSFAQSLRARYQRFGQLEDLEETVQKMQEAVDMTPENHPDRGQYLQGLGVAFSGRYQRLGDLKDLYAALRSGEEVVGLTPLGHPDRAGLLQSHAINLGYRYQRFGDLKDLEEALEKSQSAVDQTPSDHPDKAQYLHSLAVSFGNRYWKLRDLKDLEAFLQRTQESLDLTPLDHPARAERLHMLAMSLTDNYDRLKNQKHFEVALQKEQEALKLTSAGNPDRVKYMQSLAWIFSCRLRKTGKHMDAVHRWYSDSFQLQTPSDPEPSWKAALNWAAFSIQFEPQYCVPAYSAAFRLLPEILWLGHSIPVRQDAIRRLNIADIASRATWTCISLSNLVCAVEIIEQGLGTTFQQMLQLKSDVDGLPAKEAEILQNLSLELYNGTAADPRKAARQRNSLLEDIRKQPDLKYFLLPKPYSALSHASQGGPVVILNSYKDGCDGIVIPNYTSDPVHVPLPNVTLDLLESQQVILKQLLDRCNVRTRGESVSTRLFGGPEGFFSKTTKDCFSDLLTWLWTHVVDPVYGVLQSLGIHSGRLWWLPTGLFTGLPLHACPPKDEFIHSYTATLSSLLDSYAKKVTHTVPELGVVGVTHTGPGRMKYLAGVEKEVQRISSVVRTPNLQCLEGEQATPDAVKVQLQHCSWVHFACHGKQDLVEPRKSCLLLHGGVLELDTILKMPLSNSEFVFLAACQTAMGDTDLINESFHLGGGFIAAGFKGAVGTLWSMDDADGPLVAETFYTHLYRNSGQPQVGEAAEALQLAVKDLKARDVPYERWIPFIHMGL